jgi:hypothetical protein
LGKIFAVQSVLNPIIRCVLDNELGNAAFKVDVAIMFGTLVMRNFKQKSADVNFPPNLWKAFEKCVATVIHPAWLTSNHLEVMFSNIVLFQPSALVASFLA